MSERERLVELLEKAPKGLRYEDLPDYLLENGVVVLPCKINDHVWFIKSEFSALVKPLEARIIDIRGISIDRNILYESITLYNDLARSFTSNDIGTKVFLTKEEAYKEFAKKLKEEIRLEDDCDYNCRECFYECNDYVIAIDNCLKEMVGEEEMREYLVKVRYALSGLKIYRVKTDNIYRIIGKFYCTSLERINRIDYSRCTRGGERYWENEGFEINQYIEPVLSEDKE